MAKRDDTIHNVIIGDCRERLGDIPSGSIRACVTSPPYWDILDYGDPRQIGLERTPEEYVEELVHVFDGVRRCISDDGTLWLVLGDTYASEWPCRRRNIVGVGSLPDGKRRARPPRMGPGLKDKDLVGIPWRVASALRLSGWWLRSNIIWFKPNSVPDGAQDRPTAAHEHIFLFSKIRKNYVFNRHALGETSATGKPQSSRNVWEIAVGKKRGNHPATYPEELVRRCILLGSNPGDTILDPFHGSGTTGRVARELGRGYVGIELTRSEDVENGEAG